MYTDQIRTWAEIDLNNIEHNFKELSRAAGENCTVLGIVKADAYGHGAIPVAHRLQHCGCRYLAVATLDEAISLREHGISVPILILGWTEPLYTRALLKYNITASVSDFDSAAEMSRLALSEGGCLTVHLKADTGMGRLGFVKSPNTDPSADMLKIMELPGISAEGIFTHFSVSEFSGNDYTALQFSLFNELADSLESLSGKKFKYRHCANSGALINQTGMNLDMVRPGIALYGLYPGEKAAGTDLRPVLQLKTRIYQIKNLEDGSSVSYGRTHTTEGTRKIAVIPIGYADGLHRVLSGKLQVLVRGQRVSQCGRICMDMCMIDVTNVENVSVGDTVTLIGCDGAEYISADEMAEKAGSISYEMFCSLSPRVKRVYKS